MTISPLPSEPVRVYLVDDHEVVRRGLRAFLDLQPDITVVGEAGGGLEAMEDIPRLRPDVVLMDLVMPDGDGITAIRELGVRAPEVRVLVLTTFVEDVHVFAAMDAGAAGYLLKDVDPQSLAGAIRDVRRGRPALHPDVASRLMRRATTPQPRTLTPREKEVLRLMAEGLANKQIARRLEVTEKTIKTHVSNILMKLDAVDRTQAAVLAVRRRLVETEE
jgi:DNA-binding NarL/FixJ family response regulator